MDDPDGRQTFAQVQPAASNMITRPLTSLWMLLTSRSHLTRLAVPYWELLTILFKMMLKLEVTYPHDRKELSSIRHSCR